MGILKTNDVVKLKDGRQGIIVGDALGEGGQGYVYKINISGKEYALKWYKIEKLKDIDKFYNNLECNIANKAPNDSFLWPLGITEKMNGSFGYIMDLRPKEYKELSDFLLKNTTFKSFNAIINAVINIVCGFRELHNKGYSYQDLNMGNFFINPENGNVLICDNDNVAPNTVNSGIAGRSRFMAPEIVRGEKNPDKVTDRFSLSIILFMILFLQHPLEGRKEPPCMTKEYEKQIYGENPIFILDEKDDSNRPSPGADNNIKLFWPIYPDYIKDLFKKAFSHEVMMLENNAKRVEEKEWLDAFMKLKACLIKCPYCGEETFVTKKGENECMQCKRKIDVPAELQFSSTTIPLYPTSEIMLYNINFSNDGVKVKIGEVIVNQNDTKLIGIRNMSKGIWKVNLPDGTLKNVEPNSVVPIRKDYVIEFTTNKDEKGKII